MRPPRQRRITLPPRRCDLLASSAGVTMRRCKMGDHHLLKRSLAAFLLGAVAVLVVHQPAIGLCHLLGLTPLTAYSLAGRPPWGVPVFLSLTFWGGIWAIPIGLILDRLPRGWPYWVGAALLGSLPTNLTSILVILPLKGLPMSVFFQAVGAVTGFTANGVWGLGFAALWHWWNGRAAAARMPA